MSEILKYLPTGFLLLAGIGLLIYLCIEFNNLNSCTSSLLIVLIVLLLGVGVMFLCDILKGKGKGKGKGKTSSNFRM